jgi:rhodanese-related sulfurtransferase
MNIRISNFAFALALGVTSVAADEQKASGQVNILLDGKEVSIGPSFPKASEYAAKFAAVEPSCDPYCVVPQQTANGITTIDEHGVLAFLMSAVGRRDGLLVDARMPLDRSLGFIPGSVNLPHETVDKNNESRVEVLKALGVRTFEGIFNFTDSQQLVVFDNGPTQNDAGILISHLLEAGYPAEQIKYYRGGMQVWSVLGLTVQE